MKKKQGYAILNAMWWVLNDNQPRKYMFEALMQVNIVRKYKILAKELHDLAIDIRKLFVEKCKGPACEDFKKQRKHENLLNRRVRADASMSPHGRIQMSARMQRTSSTSLPSPLARSLI
jgi:hypothetical protein